MVEQTNPLVAFSDRAAQLIERAASSIVAVHGGGRGSSSGIHWRYGVIVTAEEVLERDENIKITLPDGRLCGGFTRRSGPLSLPNIISGRTGNGALRGLGH
jgi:hypothetical protein